MILAALNRHGKRSAVVLEHVRGWYWVIDKSKPSGDYLRVLVGDPMTMALEYAGIEAEAMERRLLAAHDVRNERQAANAGLRYALAAIPGAIRDEHTGHILSIAEAVVRALNMADGMVDG